MIKIRKDQMEVLSNSSYGNFESRALTHLRKFFPDKFQAMNDNEAKAFVQHCRTRAKRFRLTSEQSVMYFSHLALLLGDDFDVSGRYPFVNAVLRAPAGTVQERVKVAALLAYQLKAKGLI
jgi:hypothetical protein